MVYKCNFIKIKLLHKISNKKQYDLQTLHRQQNASILFFYSLNNDLGI
jgi:hypothetical protein